MTRPSGTRLLGYGLAAACAAAGSVGEVNAAEITQAGGTVSVRGRIEAGDELKFASVAPRGSYRAVSLDSVGGQLEPAGEIARNIKATGAVTVYDASRAACSSACTILFLAGSRRHYVRGDAIKEGVGPQGRRGLGFHEARSMEPGSSGRAMGRMTALYYEVGSPAAVELSGRSPNRSAYYISGATALSLGIATSLSAP